MRELLDDVLAGLDAHQRAAATLGPGPAQVIAPAGSGKLELQDVIDEMDPLGAGA